jgi:hypothetical protein
MADTSKEKRADRRCGPDNGQVSVREIGAGAGWSLYVTLSGRGTEKRRARGMP